MTFQEFGGNYYQPMIKYIHSKEILGPYQEREEIYMPDKCEVISDKFSNMWVNWKFVQMTRLTGQNGVGKLHDIMTWPNVTAAALHFT